MLRDLSSGILPTKLFYVTVAREKNPKGNVPIMGVLHQYSAERGLT
jgi:hypothetical protein